MIPYYEMEQGSEDWKQARLGIPTSSCFEKILTAGGKPSTQDEGYINTLLSEMQTGEHDEGFKSGYMERGNEEEHMAALAYASIYDAELIKVGFVTNDAGTIGASPDRLIEGKPGSLEIKVPKASTHVGYQRNFESFRKEYFCQAQGQMHILGTEWVDLISYHPTMKPVVVRIQRDNDYQFKLTAALAAFLRKLEEAKALLVADGYMEAA